jgi:small-conductance mechanosensitive channel
MDDTGRVMSEQVDPQGGEIEVTPEEERFLKRFFRRQLLPYFAVLLVISVTSAWWPSEQEEEGALEARTSAALAQLRTENQRLRAELETLSQRMDAGLSAHDDGANELERRVEDAKRSVRMIEARVIAATARRLEALESQLALGAPAPVPVAPAGPPPEAAAWDVSAILDRLYALEVRQEQEAATQEAGQRARAAQHAELAARIARLEEAGPSLPASPVTP